jgi:hypothetical protein
MWIDNEGTSLPIVAMSRSGTKEIRGIYIHRHLEEFQKVARDRNFKYRQQLMSDHVAKK